MPDWASVNAVKTPITYRWISELTFARKATSSSVASPARTTIPFEYASRSPRFTNWLGRKRSRASSAARRGKPWYDVFAASTRIASVNAWTR